MLFAFGRLDCRIHLPGNAKLRKTVKGSLLLSIIILHSLKKTNHALLNQVVILSPKQVHGVCLLAHQILIFLHNIVNDVAVASPQLSNQLLVRHLLIVRHTYLRS